MQNGGNGAFNSLLKVVGAFGITAGALGILFGLILVSNLPNFHNNLDALAAAGIGSILSMVGCITVLISLVLISFALLK